MKVEDRKYQKECAEAWYTSLKQEGCNPVVAVPTAGGKTIVMALMIQMYLKDNPDDQVVILSHTKLILQQDFDAMITMLPEYDIGIYSAGLGEKTRGQITIAGIQTAVNSIDSFMWTNLYIVDECHGVNHKNVGSYRKLMNESHAKKAGMSATVFRTGHGYIYKGKNALFNTLAYDLTSVDNFNKLTTDGYLAPLTSIDPKHQLNSFGARKSAGDYNLKDLSNIHDRESVTSTSVKEIQYYGKNCKSWLVFGIDIDHADHIHKCLVRNGTKAAVLHSRTKGDRDEIIRRFKAREVQALVSVGMITTGFDAPNVDMIAILRPTLSAVLHVQMIGRGLRVFPGKKACLVLDFCGNTKRLGPINNVMVPKEAGTGQATGAPVKTCPKCRTMTYPQNPKCPTCNYEYPIRSRLTSRIDVAKIIEKREEPKPELIWRKVTSCRYSIHRKLGGYPSLKVTYVCGLEVLHEWLCVNHPNGTWAKNKATHVLQRRGYNGVMEVNAVMNSTHMIKTPTQILVDYTDRYPSIQNSIL